MNRQKLEQWCEHGIIGLSLAILVLLPLAFGGLPQPPAGSSVDFLLLDPFLLAQFLLLPILALWVARVWLDPKPRLLLPPICWAVAAFTLYALGRYLTADIEYVARREILCVLVYALVFFVIINNLHRQETVQLVSFTLIGLATLIAFYALYQFLANSDRVWYVFKPYPHRGSGTYICPNHLGGFLEMILPLSLAFTFVGRVKPVTKVFLGYASLVIAAGILVTMSRGAWFSSLLALALFFGVLLFHRSYRFPALALLVLVGGLSAIYLPRSYALQARLTRLYKRGKVDDDARFALWRPAIQIWRQNIWWGDGPAHFDYRFPAFRPEAVQQGADSVHNDYLNTLVDWGLVGVALVGAAWVLLGLGVLKTWPHVRKIPKDIGGKANSSKFAFVFGASLGLVAILAHSLVDFNMHVPANAMLAVSLMALLSSHLRFATDSYWVTAHLPAKILLSLLALGSAVYVGAQAWRHSRENVWLARSTDAAPYSSSQVYLLKKAVAAEPMNPETCSDIGEALRVQSSEGGTNCQEQAREAMDWLERAMKLNKWDTAAYLNYGWCLDWLGRQNESGPVFAHAEQLDPNGFLTVARIGLHYVQTGDLAAARAWFERSLRLQDRENKLAESYLKIINADLLEAATNRIDASLWKVTY